MPVVAVGKPLREKLGDDAVDSLIDLFNQSLVEQKEDMLEFVEEKFERRLSEEIGRLGNKLTETKADLFTHISQTREELMIHISQTREELMIHISQTREELATQNSKTRTDLIKWMFIFWAGQFAALVGILFTFFK